MSSNGTYKDRKADTISAQLKMNLRTSEAEKLDEIQRFFSCTRVDAVRMSIETKWQEIQGNDNAPHG